METSEPAKKLQNTMIEQINIGYRTHEDRLLLKVGMSNNQELVAWLTRRMTQSLLTLMNKTPLTTTVSTEYAKQSPQIAQEITKNSVSQELDFSTQYEARQQIQPEEIFLVQKCLVESIEGKNLSLKLLCTNKKTITLALNDTLLMGLINMLEMGVRQAEWGFSIASDVSITSPDNSKRLLH